MLTVRKGILKFVEECLKLQETKFKWYGRDESGLDCVGLFLTARNRAGFKFFDYLQYSKLPRNYQFNRIIEQICDNTSFNNSIPLKIEDIEIGDILLLNYKKLKYPTHLIVYIGNGKYIHSNQEKGVVIEDIDNDILSKIHSVYKIKI